MKTKVFIVTITVRSRTGKRPIVRTICGDTVFTYLEEGMTGTWKISTKKGRRRHERAKRGADAKRPTDHDISGSTGTNEDTQAETARPLRRSMGDEK